MILLPADFMSRCRIRGTADVLKENLPEGNLVDENDCCRFEVPQTTPSKKPGGIES